MSTFSWPWQYDFPPFFTIQKNSDTKLKQLEAWAALVLNYHKHHRILKIRLSDHMSSELFYNKSIDRRLDSEAVLQVMKYLHKKGNIEWEDKQQTSCIILWHTLIEWSELIYKWAEQGGYVNTVLTIHELLEGDDTVGEEFHGLQNWFLIKILKVLEGKRKAELIGEEGVKFFM